MLQALQGGVEDNKTLQSGDLWEEVAQAASPKPIEPAESDSEGSMPSIDSGNDTGDEDARSEEE